ncbi:MAG: hypothetical protein MZU79_01425 [Anaerotruncus sp.]|nr:hypothetical protein [Anaerotruncus sp.]
MPSEVAPADRRRGARAYQQRFNRPAGKTDYFLQPIASISYAVAVPGKSIRLATGPVFHLFPDRLSDPVHRLSEFHQPVGRSFRHPDEGGGSPQGDRGRPRTARRAIPGRIFLDHVSVLLPFAGLDGALLVPFNRMAGTGADAGRAGPADRFSPPARAARPRGCRLRHAGLSPDVLSPAAMFRGGLDTAARGGWIQRRSLSASSPFPFSW